MDIAFVETIFFANKLYKITTEEEYAALQTALRANPELGILIPGMAGARKVRMSLGRGKSGGARVIYYFLDRHKRIYFLDIFAKSEKENLSKGDRNELAKIVQRIKGG